MTWPLSLPGVFAGSILVFIPAIGDYVNVELLGNPKSQMIGNVIQNRFLQQNDYPTAAALSFILMAGILIAIFIYARVLGTEELTGGDRERDTRSRPGAGRLGAPHGGPRRRSPARDRALGRAALHGRGDLLPAHPDPGDDRVLVQRPAGALQLRVGRILAGRLAQSVRPSTAAGRARHEPPRRLHLDDRRNGAGNADRAVPDALPVPRTVGDEPLRVHPHGDPGDRARSEPADDVRGHGHRAVAHADRRRSCSRSAPRRS